MDENSQELLAEALEHLKELKDLIHWYMSTDRRYSASLLVNQALASLHQVQLRHGGDDEADDLRRDGE